ncbi:MAG: flagellar hook-associated protein FlgK [Spirochaetia bacterium]|nr:flagellar hook-associated protein FlgK [Spirochaetia bacterium]
MSLTLAMETAIKSLRTHTYAMDTVNHNIANMNTTGYTRQLANITAAEAISLYGTAGQIGTGSRVSYIERIRDTYLDRMIRTENSNTGKWDVISEAYKTLKVFFPEIDGVTSGGLDEQIQAFWTSWQEVADAAAAGDDMTAAKNKVAATASAITTLFNEKAQGLTDTQVALTADLRMAVDDANALTQDIYRLNKEIVSVEGMGQQPNDLMDKRDVALASLAKLLNITTVTKGDGSVLVMIGGHTLVNGTEGYNKLTTVGGQKDGKLESLALFEYLGQRPTRLNANLVTGGKIGGILEMRDSIIQYYKNNIDNMASSLIYVINQVHKSAPTGVDIFRGNDAASMRVNQSIVTDPKSLSDTHFVAGDIAKILANLGNKMLSTFVVSPNTGVAVDTPLPLDGILKINGIEIEFKTSQTIKDLVNNINANISSFSAVYDEQTQQLFMVMSEQVTIEELYSDGTSKAVAQTTPPTPLPPLLIDALQLRERIISAGPVSYKNFTQDDKITTNKSWYNQNPKLKWEAGISGTVVVNYQGNDWPVKWIDDKDISGTYASIQNFNFDYTAGENKPPMLQYSFFDEANQKFYFESAPNTDNNNGGNVILPFTIRDQDGEMTQTMQLMGNMVFNDYYETITSKLEANVKLSDDMQKSYQNALDQFEGIQDSITKVDEKEELARAKLYQRAYDASVRLMSIVDEMYNMLINRTATPSTSD